MDSTRCTAYCVRIVCLINNTSGMFRALGKYNLPIRNLDGDCPNVTVFQRTAWMSRSHLLCDVRAIFANQCNFSDSSTAATWPASTRALEAGRARMPFPTTESIPLPVTDVLSWMIDESDYDKDRPVFIDAARPSRFISCRQARSMIRRLAAGLKQAGLKTGDCVCMHAFNDIHYPIACLGVVAAGGVHAGTNPAYTLSELETSWSA